MAITPAGNSPYGTGVTLTITLDGVTSGALATSTAFAPPADAAGTYYDTADIRINLGAPTPLGTTAPVYVQALCIAELDGANLPYVVASNGQIFPPNGSTQASYPASITAQYLDIYDLPLLPGATNIAIVILNNLGVTLPPIIVPAAPVLSAVAGGTLAATTYYVKITYTNAIGETLPSPESSLAVVADDVLSVASPAATSGATGWNVFVSTATGTETLQNSSPIAIGTAWQEPTTGLIAGAALPTANTSGNGVTATLYPRMGALG